MTDTIVIQPQINTLAITEDVNDVVISSVGVQGAKGDTGATGATGAKGDTGDTGAQGPSGVVTVNAPLTNAGTSSAANLSISAGTTSAAGALQLTDSVSSTSTTTAATPAAVKTAYDLADARLLKYATHWRVKYLSANWYDAKNGATISSSAYTLNRLYLYPLFIQESITIDRLGVECTVANASTTWRVGIYNADSNGVPTTVLLDAGTVDTSTTGLKTITVSQTLNTGLYYIAGVWQGGSTSPQMRSYVNSGGDWSPVPSTSQLIANYNTSYQINSGVSGALPTFSGSVVSSVLPARTQFRIA